MMKVGEENRLKIGGTYRHFKGQNYKVLAVARDSENHDRQLVVYEALYGDHLIWVRDLEMFLSPVDKEKYPNATQEYRFELIEE